MHTCLCVCVVCVREYIQFSANSCHTKVYLFNFRDMPVWRRALRHTLPLPHCGKCATAHHSHPGPSSCRARHASTGPAAAPAQQDHPIAPPRRIPRTGVAIYPPARTPPPTAAAGALQQRAARSRPLVAARSCPRALRGQLATADDDVVDRDVDELDEEADEAHEEEADAGGAGDLGELCGGARWGGADG